MKTALKDTISIFACFMIHIGLFAQGDLNRELAIKFSGYETKLTNKVTATLDSIAALMKAQPTIYYVITSYCLSCKNSRYNATRWDRTMKIMAYLVEKKGVSPDRLAGRTGMEGGDCDVIEFSVTNEIPDAIAPPHLNLRKKAEQLPCPPGASSNY